MGYFATKNSHKVYLFFFENISIQLSVWVVVAGSFVSGWVLTELWQFIAHPNRFVQIFLGRFSRYREEKKLELTKNFESASLLRDSKNVRKNFKKLNSKKLPLSVRVKYLEQLYYENSKEELLSKYEDLRTKFQGNLEVLLPYLQLACEVSDWDTTERLSHEILRIDNSHPDALKCLRKCHIFRKNWVSCIELERDLLKKFSGSLFANDLAKEHEDHLQKALRQDPNCLKNWSFSYLSKRRDRGNDKSLEAIGKANQLKIEGLYVEAGIILKEAYERNVFSELLDELENIYLESNADEKILQIVGELHNSRNYPIHVSLLFAKLLYKEDKLDEALKVLNEFKLRGKKRNFQIKEMVKKDKLQESNEGFDDLFHALRFLIAIRQDRSEDALDEAKPLLREEKFL